MGYYGCHFSFDGLPCEEFELMLYDFGSPQEKDGSFSSSGTIVKDRIPRKYKSLYYGMMYDKPLEFSFVCGVNMNRIDSKKPLDRWDMEVISSWLTGKEGYKWLEIEQPDMESIRFNCIITELSFLTSGGQPWAFECKAVCDSPYAYTFPEKFEYKVNGSQNIRFFNRSSHNGFYYPKMQIGLSGASSISIVNKTDSNRLFSFSGLPSGLALTIDIDNENGVITNNLDRNLYQYFNFNFMRFVRGDNQLSITGSCNLKFICEFPVNCGG